jgi:hypothetical protein
VLSQLRRETLALDRLRGDGTYKKNEYTGLSLSPPLEERARGEVGASWTLIRSNHQLPFSANVPDGSSFSGSKPFIVPLHALLMRPHPHSHLTIAVPAAVRLPKFSISVLRTLFIYYSISDVYTKT